ncbi:hypothetical protein HQQ80_19760 [Microbacteriaceae bacterium VKM Ac-2855]|nr:hypothetical protein [Microbacteriaceae bacterium VKM Ac-2855]
MLDDSEPDDADDAVTARLVRDVIAALDPPHEVDEHLAAVMRDRLTRMLTHLTARERGSALDGRTIAIDGAPDADPPLPSAGI